jgi:pSer/pThr/pTyr-binding forkhead associated (FHA) protein
MECQRCGLSNAEAARFCPGCGAALDSLPGSVLTTERPGPGGTLASISYTEQHPSGSARAPGYSFGPAGADDPAALDPAVARRPSPRPSAVSATPPSNEAFDLAPRPESMRPAAPEVAFAPRNHRAPAGGVAHLAVISQDGSTGQTHWIEQGSVDIGRDEGEIRLTADRFVSPRHARVFVRGGTFVLKDLGSQNGVYLRVRDSEPLNDTDLLLLGSEVLRFDLLSGGERELGPARERGTDVYGSPARPRYACLTERTVEGVSRNVFYISADEVVIGREFGDLVFTTDSFMSRRHAAIQRDPAAGTFTLRDLGSSNGTYLAIRGEVELREGDHLRVGQHLFRFGFGS